MFVVLVLEKSQFKAVDEPQWSQPDLSQTGNNLIKRVKRAAFGLRSFRSYRIRPALSAGTPNWDLLAAITSGRGADIRN